MKLQDIIDEIFEETTNEDLKKLVQTKVGEYKQER